MKRIWSVILIAPLFSLFATTVMAEGSGLIRLTDRDDLFGWEAVGRVDIDRSGYCTGVLIASDLVLTAAHCVYDDTNALVDATSITFRSGLRDGDAIAERSISGFVAHRQYDPTSDSYADKVRYDAALLKLSEPILSHIASPFKIHAGAGEGQRVAVVSYGRGRDAALSWQRDCGVLWQYQSLMAFDCNITYGSSGAPVFVRDAGPVRILSLISGGTMESSNSIAYGMELPAVVDRLKRDLRAIPKVSAKPGVIRRVKVGEGGNASGAKFAKP